MGCFRPSLSEEEKLKRDTNKRIEKQLQKDKQSYRATHRLLLLGPFSVVFICRHVCLCLYPATHNNINSDSYWQSDDASYTSQHISIQELRSVS